MGTLAGKLYELGYNVHIEAVNSLNGGDKVKHIIPDLPPYSWDYSNRYWHESRLSKDYRFRKHPYHDLLGLRLIGSTPLEPIWRNILSVDAQPWLQEHIIDGSAILPGASFLCMAMEAARQLNDDQGAPEISRFHLKNVTYSKAIIIPESPGRVELMISLSPLRLGSTPQELSEWQNFRITSTADNDTWHLDCHGSIQLEYKYPPNEVDEGREEQRTLIGMRNRLSQTESDCTQPIEHDSLYKELRRNGIDYGPNFATIDQLRIGHCQAFGKVVIPNVAQGMPSGYLQPHTIHPATFDALMHIVLPLYSRHCSSGPVMLTSIDAVSVAADMVSVPGSQLTVCCALSPSGPRSGSVEVIAFQEGENDAMPVVVLRGEKFQGIGGGPSPAPAVLTSAPFHDLRRAVKLSIGIPGVLSSLCFIEDEAIKSPLRPDEVEVKVFAFALDDVDVDVIIGRGGNSISLGDCAGTITAVGSDLTHMFHIGEHVCCWNTTVAFASQARVKGLFVQKVPKSWSFTTCAALPQSMTMAYYSLQALAQVTSGQTMFIHGAGGPLGQAVAVVANVLGIKVLATVQTKTEREALMLLPGINREQIFSFGDPDLQKIIMRSTQGVGVDVVLNVSCAALTEEVLGTVTSFGTVVDILGHHPRQSMSWGTENRAIRYIAFSMAQLLRHRPSTASGAFKEVISLLKELDLEKLLLTTAIPLTNVTTAFKAVQTQTYTGKVVLVADDETLVNIRETAASSPLTDLNRIIQAVNQLSAPQDEKEKLLALLQDGQGLADKAEPTTTLCKEGNVTLANSTRGTERCLRAAKSMNEAHQIILEAISGKMSSLVTMGSDELDTHKPLADLGLDSLIAIEFKNWLGRSIGAAMRTHEILDAAGLDSLTELVAKRSTFVPDDFPNSPKTDENDYVNEMHTETVNDSSKQPGLITKKPFTNGVIAPRKDPIEEPFRRDRKFKVNQLPEYPFFELSTLLESYLTSVQALASPTEFSNTLNAVEAFQRPNSIGRSLYDRAAAMASDPQIENWEWELQIRHAHLNRRAPLVPFNSFWFSHPLSKRTHGQAERAALVAVTAFKYKSELEAGEVKPMVLNEQELTTAYHEWIFNATRKPCVGSDEMERFPGNDYCVVMWKGYAFRVDLFAGKRPATYEELLAAFQWILRQELERACICILTSDNRHSWAEKRETLRQIDPQTAISIDAIEAAAFVICLDDAAPTSATERARQFHFGGDSDAANRWNDKSLQFVVCRNGVSGVIGEHTMLDALTLSQLNDALATAIRNHPPMPNHQPSTSLGTKPTLLPLTPDEALAAHIKKVRTDYIANTSSAEHAFLTYSNYGATFLREQKCSPKSVFQMVVQLAALALFNYTPACWETVSVAHFHMGRVEIIQVILPAVAAFLAVANDTTVALSERRRLLLDATRAHAGAVSKANRGQSAERNLSALRVLLREGEETPALYEDPVYKRARPRKIMSHCFETGMLEKGFLFRDAEAVWVHYEVYDESVYFSVTTPEAGRASRFCELLGQAAELVRQILLA